MNNRLSFQEKESAYIFDSETLKYTSPNEHHHSLLLKI